MIRSSLLFAYRSLIRNREYTLINVGGLSIAIASSLLLFHLLSFELSFDTFHSRVDRIYRITNQTNYLWGADYGMGVPVPLPAAIRQDFPQLEQVGTIFFNPNSQIDVIGADGKQTQFREDAGVFFAEPQFFNIFSFNWLHGSPEALKDPSTVVLTRATAMKYFGDWQSAIGKTLEYRNREMLKVTGILEDIPDNSDFPLKVVISWSTRGVETSGWGSISSRRQCYILLDEHTTPGQITAMLPDFKKKHHAADANIRDEYNLQPLKEIHFDSRYGNFNYRVVTRTSLFSMALIGIFLIIVASINFINLAMAQVMKRTREVGVRKVMGSGRWQLSAQFFGETLLILILASVLGLVINQASMPWLRTALALPAGIEATDSLTTILFLASLVTVVTFLAGFYPARVLTRVKPVQALKMKVNDHSIGGISLRKGLVVVQFIISQVLVIATLIIVQQVDFFRNAALGFDKDSIVLLPVPTDSVNRIKFDAFRNELLREKGVRHVSYGFSAPLSSSNRRVGFTFHTDAEQAPFEVNVKYVEPQYFQTFGLKLMAGRILSESDTVREYVVNETFLKKFGLSVDEGLGKTITLSGGPLPIVGVMEDFHLLGLQESIEPLVLMTYKPEYRYAAIKLESQDPSLVIPRIEQIYHGFFPENIFEHRFLKDNVLSQYANEQRLASITKVFSGIALLVSALGLYGLISFMAVQRTKEVGIRKVLGASIPDIVIMFYKEFILLVMAAFLVAAPLTGYFMTNWLNTFAYRANIGLLTYVFSVAFSVLIAAGVISYQSIRSALANPVDALRTE